MGRALSIRLAQLGAAVAVHYRSSSHQAEATVAAIRENGGRAEAFQADFADGPSACRQLLEDASGRLGPIRVLVNNASQFDPVRLPQLTEAHWDEMLGVNLKAPAFLCQAFLAQLPDDGEGHLIQLADWRATTPVPGHLAYTVAKAGLVALTRLLAQELAPRVRVNAIAPGAILPPPGADESYLEEVARQIPLRRAGSPQQLANALEYLLRTDFVTGEVLHLTGGQHLSCQAGDQTSETPPTRTTDEDDGTPLEADGERP